MRSYELFFRSTPDIPWRTPIFVSNTRGDAGWGCRMCIAMYGLKGREVAKLAKTQEECQRHIDEVHREN